MSVDERGGQELLQRSRWSLNPAELLTLQERLEKQELGAALTQIEQALLRYPGDVILWAYRAHIEVSQGALDQCERLYDEAMSANPTLGRSAFAGLLLAKLSCLIEQQEIGRADELCRSYLAVEPALELKVHILDALACSCLCRDKGIFLRVP